MSNGSSPCTQSPLLSRNLSSARVSLLAPGHWQELSLDSVGTSRGCDTFLFWTLRPSVSRRLFPHPCLGHRPWHCSTSPVEASAQGHLCWDSQDTGCRPAIGGPRDACPSRSPAPPLLRVTYVSLCGLFVHRWFLLLGVTAQCVVGHPLSWCTW